MTESEFQFALLVFVAIMASTLLAVVYFGLVDFGRGGAAFAFWLVIRGVVAGAVLFGMTVGGVWAAIPLGLVGAGTCVGCNVGLNLQRLRSRR